MGDLKLLLESNLLSDDQKKRLLEGDYIDKSLSDLQRAEILASWKQDNAEVIASWEKDHNERKAISNEKKERLDQFPANSLFLL